MQEIFINDGLILTAEIRKKIVQSKLALVAHKNQSSGTSSIVIFVQNRRFLIKHNFKLTTIIFKQEYLFEKYSEQREAIDQFSTCDIRINPDQKFSIEETDSIHSLLLLIASFYQLYLNEIASR